VFYGNDAAAKAKLVADVRQCCLYNGFFQITGHRVPSELQERIMQYSKEFFSLPLEEKQKVSKGACVCISYDDTYRAVEPSNDGRQTTTRGTAATSCSARRSSSRARTRS